MRTKTSQASTSGKTCESDRALLTWNVRFTVHMPRETDQYHYELRATHGQKNQVELHFPEFFISCSNASLIRKVKTYENGKEKQGPDHLLVQSRLNLYCTIS